MKMLNDKQESHKGRKWFVYEIHMAETAEKDFKICFIDVTLISCAEFIIIYNLKLNCFYFSLLSGILAKFNIFWQLNFNESTNWPLLLYFAVLFFFFFFFTILIKLPKHGDTMLKLRVFNNSVSM